MVSWTTTILNREKVPDKSYYSYLLAIALASQNRLDNAAEIFRISFEADTRYLHPLFNLAAIYVRQGKVHDAEKILAMLRKANSGNLHPRDKEIAAVAADIDKLKQSLQTDKKVQPTS